VVGCREKLEEESPALAHANLRVDRLGVGGVVSDVPAIADTVPDREYWADLMANHFGRERFGRLPVVSFRELRSITGDEGYDELLWGYKQNGGCDSSTLAELDSTVMGKVRFLVFGRIQEDRVRQDKNEDEKKKTLTYETGRITSVRLQFYDLKQRRVVWDYVAHGYANAGQDYDNSDLFKHTAGEGVLGGVAKSLLNAAAKPDGQYPAAPSLDASLSNAFDDVGEHLKERKKKK
jgi:hypothetical protein